ncbi:MAG: hypothetical protein QOK26_2770, partial [Pseudonocardiales bacterium]|nr:hypothetical protein [Pseudonocardiales bacterium]
GALRLGALRLEMLGLGALGLGALGLRMLGQEPDTSRARIVPRDDRARLSRPLDPLPSDQR